MHNLQMQINYLSSAISYCGHHFIIILWVFMTTWAHITYTSWILSCMNCGSGRLVNDDHRTGNWYVLWRFKATLRQACRWHYHKMQHLATFHWSDERQSFCHWCCFGCSHGCCFGCSHAVEDAVLDAVMLSLILFWMQLCYHCWT